jgi:hypothetical protein
MTALGDWKSCLEILGLRFLPQAVSSRPCARARHANKKHRLIPRETRRALRTCRLRLGFWG